MPDVCDRCLTPLPPGTLRYTARLRLCGDTGGAVEPPHASDDADDGRAALERALADAARLTEAELMEAVVEEFSFVLCPLCRDHVRADPAGARNVRAGGVRLRQ